MTLKGISEARRELDRAMRAQSQAAAGANTARREPAAYEAAVARFERAVARVERAHAKLAAYAELARAEGLL